MSPFRSLSSLSLAFLFSAACFGQTAQVTGRITDSSGAVMPNAKVEVTNARTGIVRKADTNNEGYYSVPLLPPGDYRMTVRAEGFKPVGRDEIMLVVDQIARIDFSMEVGALTESVTVEAGAPLVESSNATFGKVVENRRVQELPINGRNALALVMLTPAVKSNAGPTQSGFLDRGVALSSVSINGGVGATNAFVLDGVNNNQPFHGDINVSPTVDAIQEFKVQTNTMSAQYGFTGGGVVNIVSKSGTNDLHGTLYEFVRNDAFDARNAFAEKVAKFRYNQFGGSVGGPVRIPRIFNGKDRSFFFFNYEEWRHISYVNPIFTVPTAQQRGGNFSDLLDTAGRLVPIYDPASTRANPNGAGFVRDVFAGNAIPTNRLDPVSVNMLQFYPLPNRAPANALTNELNYIADNRENRTMRQMTPKFDHRINDNHSLSLRYMYYKHYTAGAITGAVLPSEDARLRIDNLQNHNVSLSETATLKPNLLNEFRLGVARMYFPFQVAAFGKDWPSRLGLPASVPNDVLPVVQNGLPEFVNQLAGLRALLTWQLFDTMTYIRGNHTLTWGFDARIQRINNFQPANASGTYAFPAALTGNPQAPAGTGSAFATFLTGAVGNASIGRFLGQSQNGTQTSLFVQDDWKVTPRLTLNIGLRYDRQNYPHERNCGGSNFNPFATNPVNNLLGRLEFACVDFGSKAFQDWNDWGPRFGFAYDFGGKGKRVVRGGYGIFYPSIYWFGSNTNTAGFANTNTAYVSSNPNLPAFQFRTGLPFAPTEPLGTKLGPSGFLGQAVAWDNSVAKNPMSQQWNFSLQNSLFGGWMLETAYSGNRSTRYWSATYNLNQLDPQYLSLGLALQDQVPNPYRGMVPGALGNATISRQQSLLPYPYYTAVNANLPHIGNSTYHAFLLSLERRMSSGFVFLASYTGGKLMSINVRQPIDFGPQEQSNVNSWRDGRFNRDIEYSIDPTDVTHRLVLSSVYELPFGKGKRFNPANKGLRLLVEGWQVNGIATIQNGLPMVIRGANNNLADRPNSTGASANRESRSASQWFDTSAFVNPPQFTFGNVGRALPDVRGPGVVNFDLSAVKNTRIGERVNLQFRAESFNTLNHVNLGFPNGSFVAGPDGRNRSASFGTITSARDPRQLQFGLKVIF